MTTGHDFWDIAIPTFSGVIGALAGGVPTYFLARRASKEVLDRDRETRRDAEKGAAHRVFVKLGIITNSLLGFQGQIRQMIERAQRDGRADMPLSMRLSTFAGIERETTPDFAADELAMFVAAGKIDYVDNLILLQRRHRAIVDGLATFAKMRVDLHYRTAGVGTTTRDETGVSRTVARVPTDVANRLNVEAEELELYTRALLEMLDEYAVFAERVADDYGAHVRGYFGDPTMPRFARKEESVGQGDEDAGKDGTG